MHALCRSVGKQKGNDACWLRCSAGWARRQEMSCIQMIPQTERILHGILRQYSVQIRPFALSDMADGYHWQSRKIC